MAGKGARRARGGEGALGGERAAGEREIGLGGRFKFWPKAFPRGPSWGRRVKRGANTGVWIGFNLFSSGPGCGFGAGKKTGIWKKGNFFSPRGLGREKGKPFIKRGPGVFSIPREAQE